MIISAMLMILGVGLLLAWYATFGSLPPDAEGLMFVLGLGGIFNGVLLGLVRLCDWVETRKEA